MYNEIDIQNLKNSINIEDIVRGCGISVVRKEGQRYAKCLCFSHSDHTPSMLIDPARGTYYCPVCGAKGDAIKFVMALYNCTYIEALKRIADIMNMPLNEVAEPMTAEQRRRIEFAERVRTEREAMVELAGANLMSEGNVAHEYLRQRGFTDDTIRQFRIGFMPDKAEWGDRSALLDRCYDARMMQHRIIFPWFSASNSIVGVAGRVLDVRTKGVAMKYVNSSEKSGFIKGNNFYGINLAMRAMVRTRRVFVVEGYTDVMAMHQSGVVNTVAQCGTALTDAQADMLRKHVDEVVLCLDNDSAGLVAMDMAAQRLLPRGLKVEVLLAPDGCDPADLLLSQGEDAVLRWAQSQTENILDMCLSHFAKASVLQPYLRHTALHKLLHYLSLVSDSIIRKLYIEKCIAVCPLLSVNDFKSLL